MKGLYRPLLLLAVVVCCVNMTGTKVAESTYDEEPPRMVKRVGDIDIQCTIEDGKVKREARGLCANDGTYADCARDEGRPEIKVYYKDSDIGETIPFTRIQEITRDGAEPKWEVKKIKKEEIKCFWATLRVLVDVRKNAYEDKKCLVSKGMVIGGKFIETGGEMEPRFLYKIDKISNMRTSAPEIGA